MISEKSLETAISPPEHQPVAVVVNDDLTQLHILSGLLRTVNIDPRVFTSAEDALAYMTHTPPPALVVTDVFMPGMDGWRFCRVLRSPEHSRLNAVPILVVSATFTGEEPCRITSDLGADAFLPSPVDGAKFVGQILALLRGEHRLNAPSALIADAGQDASQALAESLETQFGRIDMAQTAARARDLFSTCDYDLIVIDAHFPDGHGDDLFNEFLKARPDSVYIMTTSSPLPGKELEWLRKGAAAAMRKPIDPGCLIELCARARRQRALLRVESLLEERTLELRERSQLYQTLFETMTQGVVCHDAEGRVVSANAAAERILGISREKMYGEKSDKSDWLLIHEDGRPFLLEEHPMQIALKTGNPVTGIVMGIRRIHEIRYRWIIIDAIPQYHPGQSTPCGVYNLFSDITDLKISEEIVTQQKRFVADIINSSDDHIAVVEMDGTIRIVNDAWRRFALGNGAGPESSWDVGANYFKACLHTGSQHTDAEKAAAGIRDVQSGAIPSFEMEYHCDSPLARREFFMKALPLIGHKGSAVVVHRDITDRRRTEEEKSELRSRLLQSQKMELVGRLAGGVAHDFNNMLMAIIGYADMALAELAPGNALRDHFVEILRAAERSADLTRQLLAFARKQTINPVVLDLNDTIKGMLKMLGRLIGEDIELEWRPVKDIWPVQMDPAQIDQIMVNLLVNAKDAIQDGGRVILETSNVTLGDAFCATHMGSHPGEFARIRVTDNGRGMDEATLSHIFEPFFTTKPIGVGTGLGLSTVYGIVKQNEGFIDVRSNPGAGAVFTIYLPRHAGVVSSQTATPDLPPAVGGDETILLVDDEEIILELGNLMLQKLGYKSITAQTPIQALQLAMDHPGEIHLLITDVVMPHMNGRELANEIAAIRPGIKCLYMSGYTSTVIAGYGIIDKEGFFIQKPFAIDGLARKIREIFDATDDRQ